MGGSKGGGGAGWERSGAGGRRQGRCRGGKGERMQGDCAVRAHIPAAVSLETRIPLLQEPRRTPFARFRSRTLPSCAHVRAVRLFSALL